MSASLIGHHCQSPHFVVPAAWFTLLYVVGLAMEWPTTSIGRIEFVEPRYGWTSEVRFGSTSAENTVTNSRQLYPQQQTLIG
jgi:hypothetical protein